MSNTRLSIEGEKFFINGKLTYSEIETSHSGARGLLMNARFVQAIFDDKANRARFARFGQLVYEPEKNTDDFIAALPAWHACGLRAVTVGLQGGGPVCTIEDLSSIDNNPYSPDGKQLDPAYLKRLDRLLEAADHVGMIVIVSLFYQSQIFRLRDGAAIRNAVTSVCAHLKRKKYTHVIIEVANELNVGGHLDRPLICSSEGMAYLLELAREASGGMPVGCSLGGGDLSREVAEASDVILIHANDLTRQEYYNMIKKVREWSLHKPIVCNEDSACIGMLEVAFRTGTSWGYYNNMTKQEPPVDWGITKGEDFFFATRLARGIGIDWPAIPFEQQFYLQGFEQHQTVNNQRWIRLASLYPEIINYVEFFRNGELVDIAYTEPFMVRHVNAFLQRPWLMVEEKQEWKAVIYLSDGKVVTVHGHENY